MPTIEKKKVYFDRYWQEQPETKVDPRSFQRANYIDALLNKREGEGEGEKRLLDVGCGRGVILDYFANRGFDLTGVDISPDAIDMVRQKGHAAHVLDLEQEEIADKFDVILCLEVLQQIYNPTAVIDKLISALGDGGELVVSVPNEFHIVSRLKLLLGRSHLGHFDHSHIRLFSPSRDKELFEKTNLRILDNKYVSIVPPRWKIVSKIFEPLAQICPSLFAISSIYTLKKI